MANFCQFAVIIQTLSLLSMGLGASKKHAKAGLLLDRRSEEERLLEFLFKFYNPSARPVLSSNNTVNVQIQFSLMHIQELNVRNQILTATGLLIMEWIDERLKWREDVYHLKEVVIEASKLWVPEFAVINGADEIYGDYKQFRAIISSDGLIHWEPGGVFKTMCTIDITYFPFDDQKCSLIFGAWSYHTTKMNLTNPADDVNLDSYERNGEWQIVATAATRDEFSYECCPDQRFSNVAFTIHVRRRYTFYVMNIILPSMVTSVLLLSIFFCPPAQKVQIGVVVLLSFRIFLLNVTDSIPKTSDHIPLLGIYLTCTMAITTLSMILTVLVLNLHAISERPVPLWLSTVVTQYLARVLCKRPSAVGKPAQLRNNRRQRQCTETSADQVPIIVHNGTSTDHQAASFGLVSPEHDRCRCRGRSASRSEEGGGDYSGDWQVVAEVVDRMFFWMFLIAIVAISLLLFHPLTKSYFTSRFNDT